ncbi:hypothetical protein BKH21_13080, partial [Actinomyces oris]
PTPTTKEKKRGPGKPKQNKPQKPHTTKVTRSPQGHGIKNMTHYRVLKQHTHRELVVRHFAFRFALRSA